MLTGIMWTRGSFLLDNEEVRLLCNLSRA
uniref:Uncharacterized protein n=1 Tax=Arundo donax TaxID=35708 RepID=A0A0A9BTM8_ARUDO